VLTATSHDAQLHGACSFCSYTNVEVRTALNHVNNVSAICAFFACLLFKFHTSIIAKRDILVNRNSVAKKPQKQGNTQVLPWGLSIIILIIPDNVMGYYPDIF
jgi:hypothetical protein